MRRAFADTFYYLALLNSSDESHVRVSEFTRSLVGEIITTDWVITELANTLSGAASRMTAIDFINASRADPSVRIVPASRALLKKGWHIYQQRLDK